MVAFFKRYFSVFVLLIVLAVGVFSASRLNIQENLNNSLQASEFYTDLLPFLEKGKRTIIFSLDVSSLGIDTYKIDSAGAHLTDELFEKFSASIEKPQFQSDVDPEEFADFVRENLYLFLEPEDYSTIDSLILADAISAEMEKNKKTLSGTQGVGMAALISKDPLHFSSLGFEKLNNGVDLNELMETQGLYLSADKTKLLLPSQVLFDPNNVKDIKAFTSKLSAFQDQWNTENAATQLDFFGTFLIIDANATQIKWDIIITVNLALAFIVGLLIFYYRSVRSIVFFVLPGLFGIAAALTVVYLVQGRISALALSASAVIMGIVVDYSFHYFSHLSQENNPFAARKAIVGPLLVSSITTVIAFFSLLFAKSEALRDFGLFTSLSLVFTLVFILTVLPSLLNLFQKKGLKSSSEKIDKLIARFDKEKQAKPAKLLFLFVGITAVLLYFSFDVQFETDLNKLNFYPEDLKQREIAHQNINPDLQKRITVVASGKHVEDAISSNRNLFHAVNATELEGKVHEFGSLGSFLIPEKEAAERAATWNAFWQERKDAFLPIFDQKSEDLGFNPVAFNGFKSWITEPASAVNTLEFAQSFESFSKLIIQNEGTNIVNSIVVSRDNFEGVQSAIEKLPGVFIVDGASIAQSLINAIKGDFNLLLLIASLTVFITMLLVYGRIELTLISFLPMVISWIWILGLAALFGIKFNFINIMIATIIFGLGDDFAIFITDGLQSRYKYKTAALSTHKAGILLSSISTIIGTGVLLFGQHPALRSIALVSVIGISTIVLISFVIQPAMYRFFILNRTEKGQPPYSLVEVILSVYAFSLFLVGCVVISIITAITIIIPFWKVKSKKLVTHKLIQVFTGLLINTMFLVKKRNYDFENLDFKNPSILIANHSSFLDILAMAMRHPKIVILVGNWVYNSPFFGWFIRFADYIPAFNPIEDNIEKIKEVVADGYSIVVFPEGHRSPDGVIRRFHKGAFYLSENLKLPITPVLLHSFNYTLPKGEFYVKSSFLNMKALPRIAWDDKRFGEGYSARTKKISRYFKEQHALFSDACENAQFIEYPLRYSYVYKGPVLEWYFKIKYKFEKENYTLIDAALGDRKAVYDLGCGYGFLSYYLLLRDKSRAIRGFDYDDEKIKIAQNSYLKTENIDFEQKDISALELKGAEAILLSDVLHYLDSASQQKVLNNCAEALTENGIIIIKDALTDQAEKHNWTLKSERWSTRWLKFNKANNALSFFNSAFLQEWANRYNLTVEIVNESEKSSNALILIQREKNES